MVVRVIDPERRTNADLMVDADRLGWLPEPVFDATYGLGKFWAKHHPAGLTTNDLHTEADYDWDWRWPTHEHSRWRLAFGAVVFDPPYKEQGTPSKAFTEMNARYGADTPRGQDELHRMLIDGALNVSELVRPGGFLLIKCQDQIVCGRFTSQTGMFRDLFESLPGWRFESWLHLMSAPRPQRSQKKPRNNYSTLMAFRRGLRP